MTRAIYARGLRLHAVTATRLRVASKMVISRMRAESYSRKRSFALGRAVFPAPGFPMNLHKGILRDSISLHLVARRLRRRRRRGGRRRLPGRSARRRHAPDARRGDHAAAKPVERTTEYIATVKSRRSTTIQPQVEGFITRIVRARDSASRAGAVLMQIDRAARRRRSRASSRCARRARPTCSTRGSRPSA